MTNKNLLSSAEENIVLFNDEKIRRERYNDERYFSVVDIVSILTQSSQPSRYRLELKEKLRKDEGYTEVFGNTEKLKMIASGEKKYLIKSNSSMDFLGYIPYNTSLTDYAKENRKFSTKQEGIFWHLVLKKKQFLGYKFRRQKIIGSFILDFYCSKLLLGIEIDGGYHNDTQDYDEVRDSEINNRGIVVIRFTNEDIDRNLEGVVYELEEIIKQRRKDLGIK